MFRRTAGWLTGLLLLGCDRAGDGGSGAPTTGATETSVSDQSWPDAKYQEAFARYRRERTLGLTGPEGWLNLVGLHWLGEGRNRFGTARVTDATIQIEPAPQHALDASHAPQPFDFELVLTAGQVVARARPNSRAGGVAIDGAPLAEASVLPDRTVLEFGGLRATLIERGGHFALRVRDPALDTVARLPEIELFPLRRDSIVTGRLELWPAPREVAVPNVTAYEIPQRALGELPLRVAGAAVRLLVLGDDPRQKLFLIIGDSTNGRETYGGGRYLYTDPPGPDGTVVVDFNRLYNPPCVFTDWATCPLPPPQNKIAARLEAGEKKIAKG